MANGFLSQEEIDALLNGNISEKIPKNIEVLTTEEEDLIGEVGNICMGSAATALSTMLFQQVNITTPKVKITNLKELKETFQTPNIALEVEYTSGIEGRNLLVMKLKDAAVIANIMMGGTGVVVDDGKISEIEQSAVSEAMNQMIGASATAMATMFSKEINISPPVSMIWEDGTASIDDMDDLNNIVVASFSLKIGKLIDSEIMQILPVDTAKKIVDTMTVGSSSKKAHKEEPRKEVKKEAKDEHLEDTINVEKAEFQPLTETKSPPQSKNIDLIMDVPLEITVLLGRTKKNIKDVLSFTTGSLIQLDKLAEEPVEILVNGKKVAYGEVVVVDESFGVRITSIISSKERVINLGK